MTGTPELTLKITIDGDVHIRCVPVPPEHWPEARRRMASPPTADGTRHCLNHCFLPLYAWVRHQYWLLYEDVVWEHRGHGLVAPAWDSTFVAHGHGPTAAHWFQGTP